MFSLQLNSSFNIRTLPKHIRHSSYYFTPEIRTPLQSGHRVFKDPKGVQSFEVISVKKVEPQVLTISLPSFPIKRATQH